MKVVSCRGARQQLLRRTGLVGPGLPAAQLHEAEDDGPRTSTSQIDGHFAAYTQHLLPPCPNFNLHWWPAGNPP
ncbi:hypothetical protein NDU88_005772 [Pleurodeles waltl]|uniref:Uncharacterized protein n=1 Tax=Pleurodeles waltl TaxID=8319 RepID=A0AAV7UJ60_PLEWA|nr:hypothetical protein NDU88_005772 [Pleurodeles waltl]